MADSLQRFGLLLVVFGGFRDLHVLVDGVSAGSNWGFPVMLLGLLLGFVGLVRAFVVSAREERAGSVDG